MHHCEEIKEDRKEKEEYGAGSSCVSMKSDQSMRNPIIFSDGAMTSDPRYSKIPMYAFGRCFQNNLQIFFQLALEFPPLIRDFFLRGFHKAPSLTLFFFLYTLMGNIFKSMGCLSTAMPMKHNCSSH